MHISMGIRRTAVIAFGLGSLAWSHAALAQDFIKGGEEKFTFNLGGILNQFDTNVRLDGSAGQGTPINLEGNGLDKSLSSFLASGTWRIADRHRVDFNYYQANRSGSQQYDHDITIGDEVIPAGFNVNADTKARFLWLDYRYSFYKSDEFEFAGVFGIYGGNFKFNVTGTGIVQGNAKTVSDSASTTVPLPLLGVSGDWYINPRWKISSAIDGMAVTISGIHGSALNFLLSTDYMITRNIGVGVSYSYLKISADAEKSGFSGDFDWKANAFMLYATAKF